ncbi:MAG TPA: hypothetical protein VE955_11275 [Candidatus Dormibacteraeota bacterium]|nr:hypothetical protein [Candidatus Dormibacteraeota bacterium]
MAHAANISISLTGCVVPAGTCTSAGWWEGTTKNPTIVATQGDTVTLTLTSPDRNVHQFIVDVDGTGICATTDPCSQMFSSSTVFSFPVNMPSGTYDYGCTIHPQMAAPGGFIVNPSAPPDFLTTNPNIISNPVGVSGNSTITITPMNGFTGSVSLVVTTNSTSLACTVSPTCVSGGSGSSKLSCIGSSAANYLATVTRNSGSLSHFANVVYHISSGGTVGGVVVPRDQSLGLAFYLGSGIAGLGAVAIVLFHLRRKPDHRTL